MRRFWAALIVGGSCLAMVVNCGDVMFSQHDQYTLLDAILPGDGLPILDAGSDGPGSDAPILADGPGGGDANLDDAGVGDAPFPDDAPVPPDAPLLDAPLFDAPLDDAPLLDAPLMDAGVDAGMDADAGIGPDASVDAGPDLTDGGVDAARPDAGGTDVEPQPGFSDTTSFYACTAGAGGIGTLPMLLAIVFALRRRRPRR